MRSAPTLDPFDAVALAPMHAERVRAAHERRLLCDRLAAIDDELDEVARRRRSVVDRLRVVRDIAWPRSEKRHKRRPPAADGGPIPPAPNDATALGGLDLRAACQLLLRRHGQLTLRELHALLHRCHYEVGGHRPVQRLSDALRYEVDCGRARRVARGTYEAIGSTSLPSTEPAVLPLPWSADPTDSLLPPVDPDLRRDPHRWTPRPWPDTAVGTPTTWRLPEPPDPEGDLERQTAEDEAKLRIAGNLSASALLAQWKIQDSAPAPSADSAETLLATIRRRIVADRVKKMLAAQGLVAGRGNWGSDEVEDDP